MVNGRYKRRFRFFQIGFFVLLFTLGFTVYANYDYWVFKLLMAHNYIFTDALDVLYAESIGEDNVRGYYRDFDRVVMAAFTRQLRAVNQDRYTYLYTPQQYRHVRQTEKADAKTTHHEALTPDTVYLYLPNISGDVRRYVQKNKSDLAAYNNLVLDLRGNYGGLLADFRRIADLFVEKGTLLGYERVRLPLWPAEKKSRGAKYFEFEQIIVLHDAYTASAAESLIQALAAHVPNVTLLGQNTFGKGIGQVAVPLTGGYAIRATVMLVEGPGGDTAHGAGLAPSVTAPCGGDWVAQALGLINGGR
jgi:hypothetical protein